MFLTISSASLCIWVHHRYLDTPINSSCPRCPLWFHSSLLVVVLWVLRVGCLPVCSPSIPPFGSIGCFYKNPWAAILVYYLAQPKSWAYSSRHLPRTVPREGSCRKTWTGFLSLSSPNCSDRFWFSFLEIWLSRRVGSFAQTSFCSSSFSSVVVNTTLRNWTSLWVQSSYFSHVALFRAGFSLWLPPAPVCCLGKYLTTPN